MIIAFDISLEKSRRKIVAILLKYGKRINKSVFECMMTQRQGMEVIKQLQRLPGKGDCIVIIPLCLKCYANKKLIQAKKEDPIDIVRILD